MMGIYVILVVKPLVRKFFPGKAFEVDYDLNKDIVYVTIHSTPVIETTDLELIELERNPENPS